MLEDDETIDILLLEGELAFVTVSATPNFADGVEECVDTALSGFEDDPRYSDLGNAPRRTDLPETGEDAQAAAFRYTDTPEGEDPVEYLYYIDCRPLPEEGAVLRISFAVPADTWEDQLPLLQGLLDGVTVGPGGEPEPEPEETPRSTRQTPTPEPEPEPEGDFLGVEGNTYTSPSWGFSVPFGRGWDPTESTSEDGSDSLSLTNGTSDVIILGLALNADSAACQQAVVDLFAGAEGVSSFNAVNDDNGPIYQSTDQGTYGLYSFTEGGSDFFIYIQCQTAPSGEYNVVIAQQIPVDAFQDEIEGMNELANSVEF
jgi:hypothetical protein